MLRIQSTWSSLREKLTPINNISTFNTTGEITPDEFVQAGDYLVYKFPSWSWLNNVEKQRDFLPPDKQVLVSRHVASYIRADDGQQEQQLEEEEDGGQVIIASPNRNTTTTQPPQQEEVQDIDDEIFDDEGDDDAAKVKTPSSTRFYNLYITYSTSYRVPKLYLQGFNNDGIPLTPQEMFQDIVGEYKDKTATIEQAPFTENLPVVSIHPCKHASVMKTLLSMAESRAQRLHQEKKKKLLRQQGEEEEEEEWEQVDPAASVLRPDQYLVVFLKFISSVIPGIEHDNTMQAF